MISFVLFFVGVYAIYSLYKMVVRIHFVDKLKYEESFSQRQDIGYKNAIYLWVSRGYEDKFNKEFLSIFFSMLSFWSPTKKLSDLNKKYRKIVG